MIKNKKRLNISFLTLAIIWILALSISALYNSFNIDKKQDQLALEHAKNAFEKDLMFRKWVAMHGGVYVFVTEDNPPNPYLSHIPNRDLTTTSGEKLTLMNPAYTLRELMTKFTGMYGEKGHITSLKLLNPMNKADSWEKKVLKKFHNTPLREYHEIYKYKDEKHLRYMKALVMKPDCMKCHREQGYDIGDVRGGVSITIPMAKYDDDRKLEKNNILFSHLMILLVGLIIGILIYRKIKNKLEEEEILEKKLHKKDKLLQEQMKLASMGEMIGNIAHQWRQPLSVISTASSSIQVKKEFHMLTDEFIEENCEIINNNVNYLSQTIDDFKNFIKKDKKRIHFKLVENMENFLTLIKGAVNNNHITVELDIDPSIEVEAFPNELIQCYMNIFNNSKDEFKIKNMKLRLFSIKAYKENEKTVIELLDNAGGIPEEILPKIYDPYFSTKFESKGTGIGLHMTYNIIVQGLRGNITAQNKEFEYKGKTCKGALFTIKI